MSATPAMSSTLRRDRLELLLTAVLFWCVHYAVLGARSSIIDNPYLGVVELQLRRVPITVAGFLIALGLVALLQPLRRRPFWIRLLAATALVVPAAALYGLATDVMLWYVLPRAPVLPYEPVMFWQDMFPWLGSFASWAALAVALDYSHEVRDRERRLAELEVVAREAQLEALRHQMNPHFLFNTLNSISSMIWDRDPARAEEMLVALADFLRSTLEIDPRGEISLDEEIALQRAYLAIEQFRFPTRLKVAWRLPPELGAARVPALILQPLVENAIKYAVSPSRSATTVRIEASRGRRDLVLVVEDDGPSRAADPAQGGAGLGLNLVRRRLAVRYGDAGRLAAGAQPRRGFRAEVTLPLEFA